MHWKQCTWPLNRSAHKRPWLIVDRLNILAYNVLIRAQNVHLVNASLLGTKHCAMVIELRILFEKKLKLKNALTACCGQLIELFFYLEKDWHNATSAHLTFNSLFAYSDRVVKFLNLSPLYFILQHKRHLPLIIVMSPFGIYCVMSFKIF